MEQSAKLVCQVNKIIQMHQDRAVGYLKAESLAEDRDLKLLFDKCAQQSYYFAEKLQAAMLLQGLETRCKRSWAGAAFRTWMKLRQQFSSNKDQAVLRCSLAGEKMMHMSYELLCSNKYLQYYFPLLKFTFLKQFFGLKKTKEDLESILLVFIRGQDMAEIEDPELQSVNTLANETAVF